MRQPLERIGRTVHLERHVAAPRDRANVVEPVRMIRVIVSVEDCIDAIYACRNQLKPELRRCIDE